MPRAYWRVDLAKRQVEWLKISAKKSSICGPLVEDQLANVLLRIKSGEKVFERKLFVPREQIHEQLRGDSELRPTMTLSEELYFDSPIPQWAIRAPTTLVDLQSGRVLGSKK